MTQTHWLGTRVQKCPFDLWVYQEILHEIRPDLIVETGTADGGSALYLASMCDILDRGRVISIDIEPRAGRPAHDRITYLTGSSVEPSIVEQVRVEAEAAEGVIVVLDSDHAMGHVLAEMRTYGPMVTAGSYMIVEDTNVNGHPVYPYHGPGPKEAVDAFLAETSEFATDLDCEKFYLTFNPSGYLKKRGAASGSSASA